MFTQAVHPDTLRGIKALGESKILKEAYLAGGTALALQIGHRISYDLDFFTEAPFDEPAMNNRLLHVVGYKSEKWEPMTVKGYIYKTRFSLFHHPYNIIEKKYNFEGIYLAGKKDIAAMKIHALEDRGAKRDFIDTYFLASDYTLEDMLSFYDLKYESLKSHLIYILKGLSYFDDADMDEQDPMMLKKVDWKEVKKYFMSESKRLSKKLIKDW